MSSPNSRQLTMLTNNKKLLDLRHQPDVQSRARTGRGRIFVELHFHKFVVFEARGCFAFFEVS